jgi:hypothetical protein
MGMMTRSALFCANNIRSISTAEFAARLLEIRSRPDVFDVFVRFYEYMDALESEDAWVGSDTIYVITSVDKSLIESWFSDFEVSDVSELDDTSGIMDLKQLPQGCKLFAVWCD